MARLHKARQPPSTHNPNCTRGVGAGSRPGRRAAHDRSLQEKYGIFFLRGRRGRAALKPKFFKVFAWAFERDSSDPSSPMTVSAAGYAVLRKADGASALAETGPAPARRPSPSRRPDSALQCQCPCHAAAERRQAGPRSAAARLRESLAHFRASPAFSAPMSGAAAAPGCVVS